MIQIKIKRIERPFKFGSEILISEITIDGNEYLSEEKCYKIVKVYMTSFPNCDLYSYSQKLL